MDTVNTSGEHPPPSRQPAATRLGDRVFLGLSRGSGILLLVIMAAIAVFLTVRAIHAISLDHWPRRWRTWSTCSPPSPASSTACGAACTWCRTCRA
jgi:hypothetical protein